MSLAAKRLADAQAFKTLVPVRSSWTVEQGYARPTGTQPQGKTRGYHCSRCGERGHNARTCGRESKH